MEKSGESQVKRKGCTNPRKHIPIVSALSILSLSIAHASTETPTHFTLSTAMEWALKHAPVLKQIEARKQVAELELTNSKASFLPSLDFLSTQKAGQSAGTSTW